MGLTTTFHMAALRDSEPLLLHCALPYLSTSQTHREQNQKHHPNLVLFGLLKAPGLDGCSFPKYCMNESAEERKRHRTWK